MLWYYNIIKYKTEILLLFYVFTIFIPNITLLVMKLCLHTQRTYTDCVCKLGVEDNVRSSEKESKSKNKIVHKENHMICLSGNTHLG